MSRNPWERAAYAQRHGERGTSAKDVLRLLGILSLFASAAFWGPVQWQLVNPTTPGDMLIAASFTAFLVGGPPVLTSFLIPWSPGGMLLQKINARTWGSLAVVGCSLYLFYYSALVLGSWWGAREIVANADLVREQVIVGLIAYIVTPALLWAPVSREELAEQLKQAQLVDRYKVQTAGEIAILQASLLHAQQQAAVGFVNLAAGERAELAQQMRALVTGIDETIQEFAGNLSAAAGVTLHVRSPLDEQNGVGELLDYVAGELKNGRMLPAPALSAAPALEHARPIAATVATLHSAPEAREAREAHDAAREVRAMAHDAPRSGTMPHAELYTVACKALGPVWRVRELADVLKVEPPTADQYRRAWQRVGLVSGEGLSNGRFRFTECEGRS